MENQYDPRPLYEADQVVTVYDIAGIRNGYAHQYNNTPWFRLKKRFMYRVGIYVCDEMLHWLHHGKPVDGIKCGEGHDEA